MTRKKRTKGGTAETAMAPETATLEAAVSEYEPSAAAETTAPAERPVWIDGPPAMPADADVPDTDRAEPPKHWGNPRKSIFTCPEKGFELLKDLRFKQRVFQFNEKPTDEILSALKEHGFKYRADEKAWTIPANATTCKLTDELAREWAGPNYIQSVER